MDGLVSLVLGSGRTAVELALYVLLPILVLMLGIMRLLEARGVLTWVAKIVSPPLRVLGVPALGVFAAIQVLLVSFAAPAATFATMEKQKASRRDIAATLAMVLALSQANVTFPLTAVGLNLWLTLVLALAGGVTAAFLTYYVFARSMVESGAKTSADKLVGATPMRNGWFAPVLEGGHEAVRLVLRSIPILVLAILCVDILEYVGFLSALESALSPLLSRVGIPGIAVVPIATKYVAGGTAMTGVTLNLVQEGSLSSLELNRLAGVVINPFDPVGIAVLVSAGPRVASCLRAAACGAVVGILLRATLHLALF